MYGIIYTISKHNFDPASDLFLTYMFAKCDLYYIVFFALVCYMYFSCPSFTNSLWDDFQKGLEIESGRTPLITRFLGTKTKINILANNLEGG